MKPVFVLNQNVKNFTTMMQLIEKRSGRDSFGMAWGYAGMGKTRTAKHFAVQHGCVYIESIRGWSELWMYQDILKAMGISSPPPRKKQCFELILEISREQSRTMFLDEADLIGARLLESVRDLCKMMMTPWVLIGEESLPNLLGSDRRVWSRQAASCEFTPMTATEIITLCQEATDDGLRMHAATADLIQRKTGGDIRLIELVISNSELAAKAQRLQELTGDIAKKAIGKLDLGRRMAA